MIIQSKHVTEISPHVYCAEASDFGLKGFPQVLHTELGNKEAFVAKQSVFDPAGELLFVQYKQNFGIAELRLFND